MLLQHLPGHVGRAQHVAAILLATWLPGMVHTQTCSQHAPTADSAVLRQGSAWQQRAGGQPKSSPMSQYACASSAGGQQGPQGQHPPQPQLHITSSFPPLAPQHFPPQPQHPLHHHQASAWCCICLMLVQRVLRLVWEVLRVEGGEAAGDVVKRRSNVILQAASTQSLIHRPSTTACAALMPTLPDAH